VIAAQCRPPTRDIGKNGIRRLHRHADRYGEQSCGMIECAVNEIIIAIEYWGRGNRIIHVAHQAIVHGQSHSAGAAAAAVVRKINSARAFPELRVVDSHNLSIRVVLLYSNLRIAKSAVTERERGLREGQRWIGVTIRVDRAGVG